MCHCERSEAIQESNAQRKTFLFRQERMLRRPLMWLLDCFASLAMTGFSGGLNL